MYEMIYRQLPVIQYSASARTRIHYRSWIGIYLSHLSGHLQPRDAGSGQGCTLLSLLFSMTFLKNSPVMSPKYHTHNHFLLPKGYYTTIKITPKFQLVSQISISEVSITLKEWRSSPLNHKMNPQMHVCRLWIDWFYNLRVPRNIWTTFINEADQCVIAISLRSNP